MYVIAWYPRDNPDDLHCGSNAASKELIQELCDKANEKYPNLYHFVMPTWKRDQLFEKVEGGA
jgi:hypothetical protein